MKTTPPSEKVWQYVSSNCDVHGYRADYATSIYRQYARPIEQLDYRKKIRCSDRKYRSEIYICRGSERGKRLDRRAVGIISIALGVALKLRFRPYLSLRARPSGWKLRLIRTQNLLTNRSCSIMWYCLNYHFHIASVYSISLYIYRALSLMHCYLNVFL